jgi:short-subunit dehydrogenase
VKGFGVDVVIIEPGLITTKFGDTAAGSLDEAGADHDEDDPYEEFNAGVAKATAEVYKGPMAKLGGGPDAVAEKIETALTASRPKPRYTVTASAKLAMTQRRLVSDRMWDRLMTSQFTRPGR